MAEQRPQRAVVDRAVLTDVEASEVKAESSQPGAQWQDIAVYQPRCAEALQRLLNRGKGIVQFTGAQEASGRCFSVPRQACPQQIHVLTEWLLGIAFQRRRRALAEEVHDEPALIGQSRLFQIDFAGSPEALQAGVGVACQLRLLGRGPHAVFPRDQQLVKPAVVLENGLALGFGGVGCQYGLDAQRRKYLCHRAAVESRGGSAPPRFPQRG